MKLVGFDYIAAVAGRVGLVMRATREDDKVIGGNLAPRSPIPRHMHKVGLAKHAARAGIFVTSKPNKMNRAHFAIYPALALLASCTGKPPVQVSVPVAVPCIAPDKVPQLPPPLGAMPDDANAALSLAIDRLLDWRLYGIAADGVMRACSGVK